MNTYSRNYIVESDDFKKMCDFLIQDASRRGERFIWHIARLVDWKYNLCTFARMIPSNYSKYTRLWFNYCDELVGFVLSEEMNNEFQVFTKPGYEDLYPEMAGWFVNEFGNCHDSLETMITEGQENERDILKTLKFERTEGLEKTFVFDTADFSNYEKNFAGLTFQSMKDNGDYDALMDLRNNAWPKDMKREEQSEVRAYIRTSPMYRAEFNFILADGEGRHLSGCEAFIDRNNNTSEIERVCTHSDYWGKGYSRMMLQTAMRRLHEAGIKTACISGGYDKTLHLYGSLGHKKEVSRHFYKLNTI